MKKLTLILAAVGTASFASSAFASIPISAVSALKVTIYGLYTTSDATCTSGWSAVLKYNANAAATDFATSGGVQLGNGKISSPTNCILLIVKNSSIMTVAAGTYTTTTNGTSDSFCNAGLNNSQVAFYGSSSYQQTAGVTWPATTEAPTADMIAAGTARISTIPPSPTGNEVVPVYISTNSGCTGDSSLDSASCQAVFTAGNNTGTVPPQSVGDTGHGYKTTAPAQGQTRYKFTIDFTKAVGGQGGSTCGVAAPPPMKFAAF